jgi:hypothetical protein
MRRRIKEPQKRASTTASDEQIEHGPCIEAEAGKLITSQTLLLLPTCFIMPRISSADKFSVRLICHRRGKRSKSMTKDRVNVNVSRLFIGTFSSFISEQFTGNTNERISIFGERRLAVGVEVELAAGPARRKRKN